MVRTLALAGGFGAAADGGGAGSAGASVGAAGGSAGFSATGSRLACRPGAHAAHKVKLNPSARWIARRMLPICVIGWSVT